MTEYKLGADLEEYIKDAEGTLGLTPPTFDKWRASEDAHTSLAGLRALLEFVRDANAVVAADLPQATGSHATRLLGVRSALGGMMVHVEDAIADSLKAFEEWKET